MVDHQVEILDGSVVPFRRGNVNVRWPSNREPAVKSGQADRDRSELIGILNRLDDVG